MHSSFAHHHPPASVAHAHSLPAATPALVKPVAAPSTTGTNTTFKWIALATGAVAVAGGALYLWRQRPSRRAATGTVAAEGGKSAESVLASAASPARTAMEQLTQTHPSHESEAPSVTLPQSILPRFASNSAILFDLDGTLVESAQIWYELLNAAAKEFQYPPIPYDSWAATYGQSMEKNVELFYRGLPQHKLNRFCDEHYSDFLHHLHVLDGSIELLTLVRQHYPGHIVITTNCPRRITEMILSHCKLTQYFDYVVCAGDSVDAQWTSMLTPAPSQSEYLVEGKFALRPKPTTDIIAYGCYLLGVQSMDAIFVGDSKFDMMAARAAGCVSVGIGINTGDAYVNNTRAAIEVFYRIQQHKSSTTSTTTTIA